GLRRDPSLLLCLLLSAPHERFGLTSKAKWPRDRVVGGLAVKVACLSGTGSASAEISHTAVMVEANARVVRLSGPTGSVRWPRNIGKPEPLTRPVASRTSRRFSVPVIRRSAEGV